METLVFDYDELMVLWRKGDIGLIALYLNQRGIYSIFNTTQRGVKGRYEWVGEDPLHMSLLVCKIWVFPWELRHLDNPIKKKYKTENLYSETPMGEGW